LFDIIRSYWSKEYILYYYKISYYLFKKTTKNIPMSESQVAWPSSLPLANVLMDDRIVKEIQTGFRYIKEQKKLDEKIRLCATNVGNWISEKCPGLIINPNDVLSFQSCFLPAASSRNLLVHALDVDEGILNKSNSSQVPYYNFS